MRILLLAHSFNSLTQRLWVELTAWGHEVSLELDVNDAVTSEAVRAVRPMLIVAPFLKRAIPESVWSRVRCLVVHPGIVGDRGPSALDWAVQEGESRWGVTVLQANAEMDAGDIWASVEFAMRCGQQGQPVPQRSHRGGRRVRCATRLRESRGANAPTPPTALHRPRGRCGR